MHTVVGHRSRIGGGDRRARVVDEDVDTSPLVEGPLDHLRRALCRADVAGVEDHLAT
jgi:hypothetical protein